MLKSVSVFTFALCAVVLGEASVTATDRRWTIYIAQDKHLDYGWCGATTEIELRMVALLDYYLELVESSNARLNLDGTLWLEVYRRHRGEHGAERLLRAIRDGRLGYAGNNRVLLDTETAIRACYGTAEISDASGMGTRTVLVEENPALSAGVAAVLTACGIDFLGRGIYDLRAESYVARRPAYPLFWWRAPGGSRPLLVKWDLYAKAGSWGGYAEAHELAVLGGEKWDAVRLLHVGDRNSPEVFALRRQFIADTVKRYEAYGANYPISSILLLGTGYDNWTCSDDISRFIARFNAESDGTVQLVDARYQDFFEAAEREIHERHLELPELEGTFGIGWEEWGAHLAADLRDFREAARLLRLAEARYALSFMQKGPDAKLAAALANRLDALLDFAEHDCGGVDLNQSANSVDVRAGAASRALAIGRAAFGGTDTVEALTESSTKPERMEFSWHGGHVRFSPARMGVVSLVDREGHEFVPQHGGLALGEFIHNRYGNAPGTSAVLPEPLPGEANEQTHFTHCVRTNSGVEILAEGVRFGFGLRTRWFFHDSQPWIDITFDLDGAWTSEAQASQICFPLDIAQPVYRYDQPGTVLKAGPGPTGGDDLPGANDTLWGATTFAAAHGVNRGVTLVMPDTVLVQFGPHALKASGVAPTRIPGAIVAMPLMNLTRADHQLVQGGQTRWQFRFRLVLARDGGFDPVATLRDVQQFATPAFIQTPGLKPALKAMEQLEVSFEGGPVVALKVAEDGRRVIVRLWNVRDEAVRGSLRLPQGWGGAETCDALERPQQALEARGGRVDFTIAPREFGTIALVGNSHENP